MSNGFFPEKIVQCYKNVSVKLVNYRYSTLHKTGTIVVRRSTVWPSWATTLLRQACEGRSSPFSLLASRQNMPQMIHPCFQIEVSLTRTHLKREHVTEVSPVLPEGRFQKSSNDHATIL